MMQSRFIKTRGNPGKPMTNKKTKIVAVIPCYNTTSHIAEVVTKCLPHVDQAIVVDNGSTDDTATEEFV